MTQCVTVDFLLTNKIPVRLLHPHNCLKSKTLASVHIQKGHMMLKHRSWKLVQYCLFLSTLDFMSHSSHCTSTIPLFKTKCIGILDVRDRSRPKLGKQNWDQMLRSYFVMFLCTSRSLHSLDWVSSALPVLCWDPHNHFPAHRRDRRQLIYLSASPCNLTEYHNQKQQRTPTRCNACSCSPSNAQTSSHKEWEDTLWHYVPTCTPLRCSVRGNGHHVHGKKIVNPNCSLSVRCGWVQV